MIDCPLVVIEDPRPMDEQITLFEQPDPVGSAEPAADTAELGGKLPGQIRLGTSSWSFPGWAGLVYERTYPQATIAKEGLRAYAKHPLLGCVSLDRTFYNPISPTEATNYANPPHATKKACRSNTMTMLRAFARTRVLNGPGRADVDIAMTKWWTKKRPAEGQVRRLLLRPTSPWCTTRRLSSSSPCLFEPT